MGICKYCNRSVGFFRYKHSECENIYRDGLHNFNLLISAFIKNDQSIDVLLSRLIVIEENSFIKLEDSFYEIIKSLKREIEAVISSARFSENSIQKIITIKQFITKRYEYILNQELNSISFKKGKIIDHMGEKFKVVTITESLVLLNNLESDSLEVIKLEINAEYVINKYTNNSYKAFRNFLYKKIIDNTTSFLRTLKSVDELKKQLFEFLNNYDFSIDGLNEVILESMDIFINELLEQGIITKDSENYFIKIRDCFSLEQKDFDIRGTYTKLVKALILRDILNGEIPKRCDVENQIPFMLHKNEILIWLINDVKYYENKMKKSYIGGYQGISLKVAKGFYYRFGAFKGQPVVTEEKVYLGQGILGFTNKHIYFYNYKTSFRVRFDKIVSIKPSSDGFTILKDNVNAKPQTFIDGDGWFSYNLISNLSQIDII